MGLLTLWAVFTLPSLASVIGVIAFLVALICGFAFIFCTVTAAIDDDEDMKKFARGVRPYVKWALVALFVTLFVPSTDQMKYIIGGYLVTNIEHIDELPPNLVKAANRFLEEYTEEAPTEK